MRGPLCLVLFIIGGHVAMADDLPPWGEPHLAPIPRTEAEKLRIDAAVASDLHKGSPYESRSAGAATAMSPPVHAPFSEPASGLTAIQALDFRLGEALFEKLWVQGPASTISSDGLGPLYNARACSACHINDGRGHPPEDPNDPTPGLVLRLSQITSDGLVYPDPLYGSQIQDRAISGHLAEGSLRIDYETQHVTMADGLVVELQAPTYTLASSSQGPLNELTMTSPRIAPQMIGLGLMEAIPEADILANADPVDTDKDGISGRPNRVWSREFDQWMLGRFGHKAGNPTIRQQTADAANGDIGLSSTLFPTPYGDCTAQQTNCRTARNGNSAPQDNQELGDTALDLMAFYAGNLAVPVRANANDAQVLRGKSVFHSSGCADCHQPAFVTHRLPDDPVRSFQLIWPFTDLLLHDMGDGLADHRPEWHATGREWRTAPLWGLGRTEQVSGQKSFLHDGRARTVLEAIMWHGGEAATARENTRLLGSEDRAALIAFLESL
ncbi:di-heme oxidoredictase family protein [Aliiroseovarius sp. F47248L]|uniref:di-heme oxidoreductase family protein n=1 Tax=Aliiroseovarius sp. F47248L TaxID=2926420 RepID=UPI001FF1C013|nr:di-heme oxidoredictase family protein [Aliiroseovarius sp. F47248L]MCK0137685.1 thiol oxidoreductase [Aliiroseovarius sp. F47248L]